MNLAIQDITPEEQSESIRILKSIQIKANYGALVFSTLLSLEGGEAVIEDILARYNRDHLIQKFNQMFDVLSSKSFVLEYSDEERLAFYYEFRKNVDLYEYINLFDKGLFARSFASQMYSFSATAFNHLSEEEKISYINLQTKYAPIPLDGLLVATQILKMLQILDTQYGPSNISIEYN